MPSIFSKSLDRCGPTSFPGRGSLAHGLAFAIEFRELCHLAAINLRRGKAKFFFEGLLQDGILRFSQKTSGTTSQ